MSTKRRRSRRAKTGTHISSKCPTPINYRSSWELKFALHLDTDPRVTTYRYEPYGIAYVSNVRTRRVRNYWPDFEVTYVDGSKALVEIKPSRKTTKLVNVKKRKAAEEFCRREGYVYRLVTEVELRGLGLLE